MMMSAEGLPLSNQELGSDILSGGDFLSLFLSEEAREDPTTRSARSTPEESGGTGASTITEGAEMRVSSSAEKKYETSPPSTTPEAPDQGYLASEQHPLILEQNKHHQESSYGEEVYPNFRQTVIYHNNNPAQARSVSYSTVIQEVPSAWNNAQAEKHERKERHYEGSPYNIFQADKPPNMNKTNTWNKPAYFPRVYARPEQNYEVEESASVLSNGRIHGVQKVDNINKNKDNDNQKVGYVVEGRNYRKYRVEERTADGFIVGEYGVVSHDDGSLRGVRYTADGTTSPRLIYDALMKFLSL